MYLEEISDYKIKIMKALCQSKSIQKLVMLRESTREGREMMYTNIYPYSFVPETVTKANTFICFEIEVKRVLNRTFKEMDIIFWIFTHQSLIRTNEGIRPDVLSNEVDKIFNGSREFGLGTTELKIVSLVNPAKDYHGRTLVYKSTEFNRVV